MRQTRTALFAHLVWSTWDRLPLLTDEIRPRVYRSIGAKCQEMRVELVAIGGIEDHIHLLVRLPATVCVADLVKHAKGASPHLATHDITPDDFFKWQGSYSAFSVGLDGVTAVRDYIAHQREHHRAQSLITDWEPE